LRDLYARAAIVAVPLRDCPHAGGVTAVLEAAAMGRPMVVSDSAGVRDWAIDGETCLCVPCNNTQALAAALRVLANDAVLRQRIGAGARAFAEAQNAPAVFAARFAASLRRVCA
jgi:glycosyltransferase involved in cell wall biosynthesis